VGSRDYNFYALEINSGYCHWNKQFPRGWALAATIHKDSVLYLGTSDDYVMIALEPRMGTEKWRTPVKYNIFGSMALSEGMGYVGTLMGKMFGIDLKTGAVKWIFEGDGYKTNKKKYFDDEDKHPEKVLEKFDNFENVVRMYNELGGVFSTPVVTSDYIVYAGADGGVYCLAR
jgi:outer membrane protein assembly factor BamB